MTNRWQRSDAPRGDDYDARWRSLAAAGQNVHGEADLVEALLWSPAAPRCSTPAAEPAGGNRTGRARAGRHRGGRRPGMLGAARQGARLSWIEADLAGLGAALPGASTSDPAGRQRDDLPEPGSEARVLTALAGRLSPDGLLVAGFSIRPRRLSLERYDELAAGAGLVPVARWATWDREPFAGGDYAVSVHRLAR